MTKTAKTKEPVSKYSIHLGFSDGTSNKHSVEESSLALLDRLSKYERLIDFKYVCAYKLNSKGKVSRKSGVGAGASANTEMNQ